MQIDGKDNEKIQTVFFKDLPIETARFTPDGSEVILAGRRKFFYSYNVLRGKVTKVRQSIYVLKLCRCMSVVSQVSFALFNIVG